MAKKLRDFFLRCQRHSCSKQQWHIPNTSLEARMKPKKLKIVSRGPRPQNSCKSRKSGSCSFSSGVQVFSLGKNHYERCSVFSFFWRSLSTTSIWMQTSNANGVFVLGAQLPADRKVLVHLQLMLLRPGFRHFPKDEVSLPLISLFSQTQERKIICYVLNVFKTIRSS